MTTEQAYIKYICSNCNNTENECAIRTTCSNVTYCKRYKRGNNIKGYTKQEYRTAKYERCVMLHIKD